MSNVYNFNIKPSSVGQYGLHSILFYTEETPRTVSDLI